MARSNSMTYDPTTGKWSSSNSTTTSKKNTSTSSNSGSSTNKTGSGSSGSGNLSASTSDKNSATGSAEKKYNTIEYNILTGKLNFIATESTIKLNAGDTVTLNGFGKYLSGNYYVQDVERVIGTNGYSHSATVVNTDFGDSLKKVSSKTTEKKVTEKKVSTPAPAPAPKPAEQVYYLKKGECLWSVAAKFYGNGALYPKIATRNNISPAQYTRLPIGLKLYIP